MGLFGPDAATVLATSKQPEKVLKALASPKSPAGAVGLVLTNPNLSGPALETILATLSREQILALLDTPPNEREGTRPAPGHSRELG